MRRRHVVLVVAAALAAGGWWFARPFGRTPAVHESSPGVAASAGPGQVQALGESNGGVGGETLPGATHPGASLRPPEPNRRFMDFTPEQRVDFARRGHGPGG